MRTYAGLLLLENIFDTLPSDIADVTSMAQSIFYPNLPVVDFDCGTLLGKSITLSFESEGLVAADTGQALDYTRIYSLLSNGQYTINIRHTSACISQGGVCAKCYNSTYPRDTPVFKGQRATIRPEYEVASEIIVFDPLNPTTVYTTVTNPIIYDNAYLFYKGQLVPSSNYTLVNGVLTLHPTLYISGQMVIRYTLTDTTSFMHWLASTYSGYILGMAPLPAAALPIRSLLLTSLILDNRLQSMCNYIKNLDQIPPTYVQYIDSIIDPLEKALYVIAIYTLYYNVLT